MIDHFVNVLKRPIVSIHDIFITPVRDTELLILIMADCYTIYVDEMILMRGIKDISIGEEDISDAEAL